VPALLLVALGLLIGVFVEGVVSSFHFDGSLWPWPHCRDCGYPAPPAFMAPVLGAMNHARCRRCGRSSRARAAQVQVATALAFLALGLQYWSHPLLLAVSLVEAALLVAVLFIDLELRLIPPLLVVALVTLALGSAAAWPGLGLWSALLGGALAFAAFGLLVIVARFVFGEGALGMGDANLALAIGCITGYPLVTFTLSVGVFLGGIGAMAMLIVARRGLRSTMPYGPYLVLAVLYVLAHGNTLNPLVHL
jgi:leader peptidase (prepilin peptidase)/N-methyltransferase